MTLLKKFSPLHLCATQALGLWPKLSIEELKTLKQSFEQNLELPEFLLFKVEPYLNDSAVFQILEDRMGDWQKRYHVVSCLCPTYPQTFLHLQNPPPLLFVEGELSWLKPQTINLAVVGKREIHAHTMKWMNEEFYKFLEIQGASKNINILSGGARGIDQKAHTGALLYQHPTTVLLPSGLDCIYPQSLLSLKDSILENSGALISHYLPEAPMRKQNFYSRNELIAALADACLVIAAEKRSGTYKTALYCQTLGTPLAVLPSFPLDTHYSGSLQLIYDGATMVRDASDLCLFKSLVQPKSTVTIDQIQYSNT